MKKIIDMVALIAEFAPATILILTGLTLIIANRTGLLW